MPGDHFCGVTGIPSTVDLINPDHLLPCFGDRAIQVASHPPRPKQPCGGPDKGAAPISPPVTPTTGTGEQRPLLRVLASAGRTHRREVADEIRRARNQLQAPMGQARPQGAGPPPIVQCLDVCL